MVKTVKRIGLAVGLTCCLLVVAGAAVWTLRRPLLGSVLTRQLQAGGFATAAVQVLDFDLSGLSGTVRLVEGADSETGRFSVTYSLDSLLAGRVHAIEAQGVQLPGALGANGSVDIAGVTLWDGTAEGTTVAAGAGTESGTATASLWPMPAALPFTQTVLTDCAVDFATPVGAVTLRVDAQVTPSQAGGLAASVHAALDHADGHVALQAEASTTADGSGRARLRITQGALAVPALRLSGLSGQLHLERTHAAAVTYNGDLRAETLTASGLPVADTFAVQAEGTVGGRHNLSLELAMPAAAAAVSAEIAADAPAAPAAGAPGGAVPLTARVAVRAERLAALLATVLGDDRSLPIRAGSGTAVLTLRGTPDVFPPASVSALRRTEFAGALALRLADVGIPDLGGVAAVDGALSARVTDGVLSLRPQDCLPLDLSRVQLAGYRLDRPTRWCARLDRTGGGDGAAQTAAAVRFDLGTAALTVPAVRLALTDAPAPWALQPVSAGRPAIHLDAVRSGTASLRLDSGLSLERVDFVLKAARFRVPAHGISGGNLAAEGRWQPAGSPVLSVSAHAGGLRTARTPAPVVPLAVDLTVRGNPSGTLTLDGWALGAPGLPKARLTGRHDSGSGRGDLTARLEPLELGGQAPPVEALFPVLRGIVRDVTGRIEGRIGYRWGGRAAGSDGHLLFEDVAFGSDLARVEGLNGPVALRSLDPPATDGWQTLGVGLFNPGLPLTSGVVRFRLSDRWRLSVNQLAWDWAGGRLRAYPFEVSLDRPQGRFEVLARDLSLAEILALTPFSGLSATGRLDGRLPVTIEGEDLRVSDGQLATTESGRVRYEGGGDPAALSRSLMSFDLETLKAVFSDFRYDRLSLGLDGTIGGEMVARIRVSGANPDFQGGHPVRLNLNLSGKLVSILQESLRVYRIPEQVRQRIQEYRQQQRQE